MSKLNYEEKINIYNEREQGISISTLYKKYNVRKNVIQYMVCLIDKRGIGILRKIKNMFYPKYKKEKIINRVLISAESIWTVAIDDYINYYNYARIKAKLKGFSPVNYRLQSSN